MGLKQAKREERREKRENGQLGGVVCFVVLTDLQHYRNKNTVVPT